MERAFLRHQLLARANVKQIVESESLTELAIDCMAEVHGAALTRGIDLRPLAFRRHHRFFARLGRVSSLPCCRIWKRGKPLEYEAFNGIVIRVLRQAGQTAPINQTFYALLQHLDRKSREEAAP